MSGHTAVALAAAHRREWTRLVASAALVTRDLDAAEDAVGDAFAAAARTWSDNGVPRNPGAWLATVSRRNALSIVRRRRTAARNLPLLLVPDETELSSPPLRPPDDRLRLVFTCAHPALSPEARVALTLRVVCGIPTAEVADLLLVSPSTMAARLTRAKRKIRAAGLPYRVPTPTDLPARLPAVLDVVNLFFMAGHAPPRGPALVRDDVAHRATDLARILAGALPTEAEVIGLLATLVLANARRAARTDANGTAVASEDHDRSRWNRDGVLEGLALVRHASALAAGNPGRFVVQAAIAGVHTESPDAENTDWAQILALYDRLCALYPSPVAQLGRAVAIGMARGAEHGLAEIDRLQHDPRLRSYHRLPAARADLLRRLGRATDARRAYLTAADLTENTCERDFLLARAVRADDQAPDQVPPHSDREPDGE